MYFQSLVHFLFSDWNAVELNAEIPWDLEGTPLHIKTDSTLGSDEAIVVVMLDKDSSHISGVQLKFSSPMQYHIYFCVTTWTDLPVNPPMEVEKIWTITKTEAAFIITCNEVEVVNFLFADSSNSNCVPNLGGNTVEQIEFRSDDTASDFYRAAGKV